jgi:hypothetical protein
MSLQKTTVGTRNRNPYLLIERIVCDESGRGLPGLCACAPRRADLDFEPAPPEFTWQEKLPRDQQKVPGKVWSADLGIGELHRHQNITCRAPAWHSGFMERLPRTSIAPCALEPTTVGRVSPRRAAIANPRVLIIRDGAQRTARPTLRFMGSLQSERMGAHGDHEPD